MEPVVEDAEEATFVSHFIRLLFVVAREKLKDFGLNSNFQELIRHLTRAELH